MEGRRRRLDRVHRDKALVAQDALAESEEALAEESEKGPAGEPVRRLATQRHPTQPLAPHRPIIRLSLFMELTPSWPIKIRGDIGMERLAVQDLSSLKFGVSEVPAEMNKFSRICEDNKLSNTVFGYAAPFS
jgi:hypothetical protein